MLERVLNRFRSAGKRPLRGAPAVRRVKSYSAQTGYVFQYFYLGQRPVERPPGDEHCFNASHDRKTSYTVSVVVPADALRAWEQRHGRELASNERYAVAKMALFQAFDEREPGRMQEPVTVRAADAEAILSTLGID